MRCDLSIAQPGNHHVIRLCDVLRVFEDVEVFFLDLLTLGTLLAEVDQFGVLFRTLDRLEEWVAGIRGFYNEIRRIVVNILFGFVIPIVSQFPRAACQLRRFSMNRKAFTKVTASPYPYDASTVSAPSPAAISVV